MSHADHQTDKRVRAQPTEHFSLRELTELMASSPAYYQRDEHGERRWVSGELVGRGSPSAGSRKEKGKTPVEGPQAVQNWLGLHDRAKRLRETLDLTQPHLRRQAHQAVASLFLYEHQLTEKARRQARLALWDREHPGVLPVADLPSQLLVWSRCRCPNCQPALHHVRPQAQESSHSAQRVPTAQSAQVSA